MFEALPVAQSIVQSTKLTARRVQGRAVKGGDPEVRGARVKQHGEFLRRSADADLPKILDLRRQEATPLRFAPKLHHLSSLSKTRPSEIGQHLINIRETRQNTQKGTTGVYGTVWNVRKCANGAFCGSIWSNYITMLDHGNLNLICNQFFLFPNIGLGEVV